MLGRTLKVDVKNMNIVGDITKVERAKFTRACIETDLRKKLRSKVRVGRRIFGVEYEGL